MASENDRIKREHEETQRNYRDALINLEELEISARKN